ncbi:S49 family peptidase [Williamsia maris]|uniref:Signal peptide peptidase SppA n=1 Tax=Williamsia maris TaxID=72806 RepID=A0ABT1HEU4_9NOCA|nr:S49 family peptidase [Williamsia maris]MCP2176223.1 signal peptide peptidase SppA [Williamsia maris]
MSDGPLTRLRHALGTPRPDRVAVVRLEGHIGAVGVGRGGLTADGVEGVLKRAFTGERVKAVVLVINSPGGSPAQSEYIAERVRQLASENGVRVLAFCEDVAASGGYWIACAADEIFAARTSMVGSIGVVSSGFGAAELIGKIGLERRIYSAGNNKARLDVFSEEKPEDVEWLSGIQADLHEAFIAWVRQRRGAKLSGDDETLFSGDVWIGRRAVEVGLVDAVGVLRSVIAERYPDAEVDVIAPTKPLLARLTGGQLEMAAAVDGVVTGAWSAMEKRARWSSVGL